MVIDPEHGPISLSPQKIIRRFHRFRRLIFSARSRVTIAWVLRWLAWLAFGLTIITIPWRQRILLQVRPQPPLYAGFTDLLLFSHDILLLLGLLLWGTSLVMRLRRLTTGPFFLWWPLLGLTAITIVSAFAAVDRPLAMAHVLQVILLSVFFLYIVNEARLSAVIGAVAIQVGLQAAVGLAQVWRQQDLGVTWLGEHTLEPATGSAIVWAEGGLQSLRAYGLADHPNILAAGLAFSLLLLAAWAVQERSRWWMAAAAFFAWGGLTLFVTFSRPAWIAFSGGALVAMGLFWRTGQSGPLRRWAILPGVTLLLLLPAVWLHLPYLRLGTSEAVISARVNERLYEKTERDALNGITNELFIHNAITGVGVGNLPVAMRQQQPDFGFDYQPARITMLAAAAEIGLIGALFYFVLLLAPWLALAWRRERLAFSPLLVGLSGVLAAVTIFNLFDAYAWFYPSGRLWQWLVWGLWAAAYRQAGTLTTLDEANACG